jgi:hypothetical protein
MLVVVACDNILLCSTGKGSVAVERAHAYARNKVGDEMLKLTVFLAFGFILLGTVVGWENDGSYTVKEFGSSETKPYDPLAPLQGLF